MQNGFWLNDSVLPFVLLCFNILVKNKNCVGGDFMKNIRKDVPSGKVVYNNSIVSGIVSLAIAEIEGVTIGNGEKRSKKDGDVLISFENDNVFVDVTVSVLYGYNIPDVAYNIQQSIKHNVEAMTEYKIAGVDVHVVNVKFDENDKND